jgi:hypothetical protein
MADKLRKFRPQRGNLAEKRFGKDINVSTTDELGLRKPMTDAETKSVSKAQPSSGASPLSFSAAFRAARNDPDKPKTFMWKGKSFTTEMAGEKKSATPPVRRAPASSAKATPTSPAKAATSTTTAATPSTPKKDNPPAAKATAATPATKPKPTVTQQRGDYASRLTQSAAEKRKLESAPTSTSGASWARLKNAVGFGSSADERLAATMRRSAANQAQNEARMNKVKAERAAAAAERIREGKEKAKAGNPFYKSYLEKAKGGSVKGYAKGGKIDGAAVRGKTKAGRK